MTSTCMTGTAFLLAGMIVTAGAAQAGTRYDFSQLKPLPPVDSPAYADGFLRDFRLNIQASYARSWNRGDQVPLERTSREVGLGLQFRIGDRGFASLSGQFGREDIATQPAEFPLDMDNEVTVRGFDVMAGLSPLPGVTVGAMAGRGHADSSYVFLDDPALTENRSSGDNTRFGGFAGLVVPTGTLTYTATATILRSLSDQQYNPGNVPPENAWSSTSGILAFGMVYPVSPDFSLKGDIAYTRILSQTVAAGSPGRDRDWLTLKATALYNINEKLQVQLGASTWAWNDTAGQVRVTTGLTYKF